MSVSDRIAALTPEQRELFERRRRRLAAQAKPKGEEAIPRREPDAVYPLSFDQERLWFLYYLDPQATAYNIDTSTRMEGRLDVLALGRGLAEIVRRHEAWRTTFPEVDGRPVQVIADELPPELRVVDLSALDAPRPEIQTTRGAEQPVEIAGRVAAALKALARAEGATPFMAALAAWKAVLFRVTGQETVLIGSPNANRNKKELEPLLGFFLTQRVFATDGSGDPTFRELVRRVRRSALGAYAHQDLPFGKLLEALKPERDNSRTPLV